MAAKETQGYTGDSKAEIVSTSTYFWLVGPLPLFSMKKASSTQNRNLKLRVGGSGPRRLARSVEGEEADAVKGHVVHTVGLWSINRDGGIVGLNHSDGHFG